MKPPILLAPHLVKVDHMLSNFLFCRDSKVQYYTAWQIRAFQLLTLIHPQLYSGHPVTPCKCASLEWHCKTCNRTLVLVLNPLQQCCVYTQFKQGKHSWDNQSKLINSWVFTLIMTDLWSWNSILSITEPVSVPVSIQLYNEIKHIKIIAVKRTLIGHSWLSYAGWHVMWCLK